MNTATYKALLPRHGEPGFCSQMDLSSNSYPQPHCYINLREFDGKTNLNNLPKALGNEPGTWQVY